jgi:hypothetical protein
MIREKTQNGKILKHLKKKKSITPYDALNLYDCFRLSARIYDLREMGHKIKTEYETKKDKTYARYRLET